MSPPSGVVRKQAYLWVILEQRKAKHTFLCRGFATRFRTCGNVAHTCARAPTWTCSRAISGVAILAKISQAPWKKVERLEKNTLDRGFKITDKSFEIVGMEKCDWCQRPTQMIAIELKEHTSSCCSQVIMDMSTEPLLFITWNLAELYAQ